MIVPNKNCVPMQWGNILLILLLTLLLSSCGTSDNSLFVPDETNTLTLSLYITNLQDSTDTGVLKKTDTIHPGDSLYLHARIRPSALRIIGYFWKINNQIHNQEFSISKTWDSSGLHTAYFYAIDQRGDTLYDSLQILVDAKPKIHALLLPINLGKQIPINPEGGLRFEWNATDAEQQTLTHWLQVYSVSNPYSTSSVKVLDTALTKKSFYWHTSLTPLQWYKWRIISQDVVGLTDTSSFAFFSTTSINQNTSRLQGQIFRTGVQDHGSITIKAQSELGHLQTTTTTSEGFFDFKQLQPGLLSIAIYDSMLFDFAPIDTTLRINPGVIDFLPAMSLVDTAAPSIAFQVDTLQSIPHTIRIFITEQGTGIDSSSLQLTINNTDYTEFSRLVGDSLLTVHLPGGLAYGAHTVNVTISDFAQNTAKVSSTIISTRSPLLAKQKQSLVPSKAHAINQEEAP